MEESSANQRFVQSLGLLLQARESGDIPGSRGEAITLQDGQGHVQFECEVSLTGTYVRRFSH